MMTENGVDDDDDDPNKNNKKAVLNINKLICSHLNEIYAYY